MLEAPQTREFHGLGIARGQGQHFGEIGAGPVDRTRVAAQHGLYREDTKILKLDGAVQLQDARGYRFNSERAVIDTQKNDVDGDTAVTGDGPLGQIAASSYAVRDGGKRILFNGHVKARIQNGGQTARPAATKR